MRRTVVLTVFAVAGLVLVTLTTPPPPKTGAESVRGARAFLVSADAVTRVEVDVGTRRVVADRVAGGWKVDAAPARPQLGDALDALVQELAGLRAVDAFRPSNPDALGLAPPAGSITVATARGVQRLDIGALNAAGSTFYARRDGHERVLQLGVYLLELVRRVVDARDAGSDEARGYWPEIG
jgi:hypothetical protein